MKKFLSGLLCGLLIAGLALSATAISSHMTIEVDPINIQVNGETFVPTDVNGNEVPVFAYNGTTYAPLRALAEAYGLEVGYDAESNMATVTDPDAPAPKKDAAHASDYDHWSAEDEAAYQEFKGMWVELEDSSNSAQKFYNYTGALTYDELTNEIRSQGQERYYKFLERFSYEHNDAGEKAIWFEFGTSNIAVERKTLFAVSRDDCKIALDAVFENGKVKIDY